MMRPLIQGSHRYAKGPHGYYLEGDPDNRGVVRVATLEITGAADATQVAFEITEATWNSETLATETVDTDTPTGGTRFDISADGLTGTIKGLSQTPIAVISHDIHNNDVGVGYAFHGHAASGTIHFNLKNWATGANIDMSGLGANKVIEVMLTYLTSS